MLRQGDLLFVKCEEIPNLAEAKIDGVIAEGESTGHKHRIESRVQAALLLYAGIAYIKVLEETHIKHEEHKEIILPIGDWIVKRQREYQPDGWKQVAD
jgi:hypothetical protein